MGHFTWRVMDEVNLMLSSWHIKKADEAKITYSMLWGLVLGWIWRIWKLRCHSENASNIFSPYYAREIIENWRNNHRSFVSEENSAQGNVTINVTSAFTKSSIFSVFFISHSDFEFYGLGFRKNLFLWQLVWTAEDVTVEIKPRLQIPRP